MPVSILRKGATKMGRPRKGAAPPTAKPKEKPKSNAFKRIFDLGQEKVALLNQMFAEDKPIGYIITTLQDGWQDFVDTKPETLKKYLYRYKWEVADKRLVTEEVYKALPPKQMALVEAAMHDLDLLAEMQSLVIVQKGRVNKMLKREADMPMLFNSLGGEMKTLASFLQQTADLSFELGKLKRVPNITHIKKDGHTTTVESEGKEYVTLSMEAETQVEKAAREFFAVLEEAENDTPSI